MVLEPVVGSSAHWILDTQFDRKAKSSAMNENDFVIWRRQGKSLFARWRGVRRTVKTTNSFSPFGSTLMTIWLTLSFLFLLSFSLSGLGFSLLDPPFPVVTFGIVHSPLMARTFPPFLIFTQSNRLLVRMSILVLVFFLVVIESSLLGRRLREVVDTNDWNRTLSPGSRIEDLDIYQQALQENKATVKF